MREKNVCVRKVKMVWTDESFQVERLESRWLLSAVIDTPIELSPAPPAVTIAGNVAIFSNPHGGVSATGAVFNPAKGTVSTIILPAGIAAGTAVSGNRGVATVDGKTIFAGGLNTTDIGGGLHDATGTAYIYDQAAGAFTSAMLSAPRDLITAVTVGDKAIFAGGVPAEGAGGPVGASNAVDIYDAKTGAWTTGTLSESTYFLATAVSGSKAYFAPISNQGAHSNLVDVYDSANGQWSTLTPPADLFLESATAGGTKIVFLGESGARQTVSGSAPIALVAEIYDTGSGKWSTDYLGTAGFHPTIGVAGNQVIFAGGTSYDSNGRSSAFKFARIFNAGTAKWSTSKIPEVLTVATSVTVGSRVIFAQFDSSFPANVEIYDSAARKWSTVILSGAPGNNLALQAVGNQAIVYGIHSNNNPSENRVDILSWVQGNAVRSPVLTTPSNGAHLAASPSTFTWSSTPGASAYDVYVDGAQVARVTANALPFGSTLATGTHTMRIVARVGRRKFASLISDFTIVGS